jgi:CYTH domain-containing protein
MTPAGGGPARLKLGQKVPAAPGLVLHTTISLTPDEYELLRRLPGADLRKVRHALVDQERRFAVDVFEGRHAGLVLVEIELAGEDDEVSPPPFAGAEVTDDERYTGGRLAFSALSPPRQEPAGSPPG